MLFSNIINSIRRRGRPVGEQLSDEILHAEILDDEVSECYHFELDAQIVSETSEHVYIVLERHHGGFGAIYVVKDVASNELSVLKALRKDIITADLAKSFKREAVVWVTSERHPNLVSAFWMEEIGGVLCLMVEYVDGGSMAAKIRANPLPEKDALDYAIQICDGMAYASERFNLIHLDLKPSNCIISKAGTLKISDFGMANSANSILLQKPSGRNSSSDNPVHRVKASRAEKSDVEVSVRTACTEPASFAGTLSYMAPEQFSTEQTRDTRSDIYSLGVTLYEMLTQGRPGFGPAAALFILQDARRHIIRRELLAFILQCVDPDPEKRPQSFRVAGAILDSLYRQSAGSGHQPSVGLKMEARDWQNIAVALDMLMLREEALTCTARALRLAPGDPVLIYNMGMSLYNLGRYKEAIGHFDQGLAGAPKDPDFWCAKVMALVEMEDFTMAEACCNQGLAQLPNNPDLLKSKGTILHFAQRKEDAGRRDHIAAGKIPLRYQQALQCYLEGMRLNTKDGDFYKNIAGLYCDRGEPELALEYAIKGTGIAPFDPYQWQNLALAYFLTGQYPEARDAAGKGLLLDPSNSQLLDLSARLKNVGLPAQLSKAGNSMGEQPKLDFPDLRLLEPLDFDGVGELWRFETDGNRQPRLLRLLRPGAYPVSIEDLRLFERETRHLLEYSHPNLVRAIYRGTHGGAQYVILEASSGQTAESLRVASGGRIPYHLAVSIAVQVLEALKYLHSQPDPLINRDIRPQTILVNSTTTPLSDVKLLSYGAARTLHNQCFSSLTVSGDVRGCVPFISPEQIRHSHKVDHRTDLFAVGATLYYLLTGRYLYPFCPTEAGLLTICMKGLSLPLDWTDCAIPTEVATIVQQAVHADEQARFQSAGTMQDALRASISR